MIPRRGYAPGPHLVLVPTRRTFAQWGRDRQREIFAELSALRADLKRLQRMTQTVARCHQCHVLQTIHLDDAGNWRCKRCLAAEAIA